MVDHHLVQADLLRDVLAVSDEGDVQHRPFFDSVIAIEESLETDLHVFGLDLGQESKVTVVDPQDRDVERSCHPRPGQEGSVAAQREDEVGSLQEAGGSLGLGATLELDGFHAPLPHRVKDVADLVLLHARSAYEADLHAAAGWRWTKISWLPSAPVTSDGASPRTV